MIKSTNNDLNTNDGNSMNLYNPKGVMNQKTSKSHHPNQGTFQLITSFYNIPLSSSFQDNRLNKNMIRQQTRRKRFSNKEDEKLMNLVEFEMNKNDNSINWNVISLQMDGRTNRQCRDRYMNYLKDGGKIKKGNWTDEENETLLQKYKQIGPDWIKMRTFFTGRSNINLKNHYWCLIRRKKNQNDLEEENIEDRSQNASNMENSSPTALKNSEEGKNEYIHHKRNDIEDQNFFEHNDNDKTDEEYDFHSYLDMFDSSDDKRNQSIFQSTVNTLNPIDDESYVNCIHLNNFISDTPKIK